MPCSGIQANERLSRTEKEREREIIKEQTPTETLCGQQQCSTFFLAQVAAVL